MRLRLAILIVVGLCNCRWTRPAPPESNAPSFIHAGLSSRIAPGTETLIDDFESPDSPAPWVFSNGPEFPGATGSLTSAPGHVGQGARLAYDFSGGGRYVSATLHLSNPLQAAAIGFWAQVPPGIHASLRVVDATGQTLQYNLSRPLDALDPGAWFRQVVELDAPTLHYGGANDGILHLPIRAITLLAADPFEAGASGAITLDDVVALDALGVILDPAALALVASPPGSEDLASRLGVNIHFTRDDQALDLIRDAGFSFVRMDLFWGRVERTKGVYDFSPLDELVASLSARGMRLHLILDYFNPLYPGASSPDFATTTVPAFAAVSRAAAARFAGTGATYEIWNEPNLAGFWPPRPDALQYAALSRAAIAAVHEGDPEAMVTTGGLSSFDFAFLRAYVGAGGATGANALGVHPYRRTGGETMTDELVLMRLIAYGTAVWDTEWGYSSSWFGPGHDTAARIAQARFAVREILSAWAVGFPFIVYYDIRDDGTDPTNPEHNFGLIQNDYLDKPGMVAMRTLSSTAFGRRFVGFWDLIPTSLQAMVLDGPADSVAVVWSSAPGGAVNVTLPKNATAVDMMGSPLRLSQAACTSLIVREADGPIYVTFPK